MLRLSDRRSIEIIKPPQQLATIFTAVFSAPPGRRIIPSPRRIRAESRRTGRGEGSGGAGVALHQAALLDLGSTSKFRGKDRVEERCRSLPAGAKAGNRRGAGSGAMPMNVVERGVKAMPSQIPASVAGRKSH